MKKNIYLVAIFAFAVLIFMPLFAYGNAGNLQWSNRSPREMNWNNAVNYCKNLREGGYSDWRLPNIDELRTLIQNHSGTQTGGSCPISEGAGKLASNDRTDNDCGSRDGSNFSKFDDTGWLFWSSSTQSDDSSRAWGVGFNKGYIGRFSKSDSGYVRCVMSKKRDNSEPSTVVNLMWSEKAPTKMKWYDAINYCKNLNEGGYTNWRLPNIDELRTVIQHHSGTQTGGFCQISEKAGKLALSDKTSDCIGAAGNNFSKLGDTDKLDIFWSSSGLSDDSDAAWYVGFGSGALVSAYKNATMYVRCVRSPK